MATRFIPETHGMVTVAPERRLSGEGFASARADHAAASRSSDRLWHFDDATVARFWRNVTKGGDNECWPWTGALSEGYGRFRAKGKLWLAHRLAKSLEADQPVPTGVMCCHKCDNRRCVNPSHIFLGSAKDNAEDAKQKGRWYQRRAHCVAGHPYTDENTYTSPKGGHFCRTCAAASDKRRRDRERSN